LAMPSVSVAPRAACADSCKTPKCCISQ
jgi:hypothetical protein